MHLLVTQSRTLEEADAAVDLGQSPADVVILSFSDSDLGVLAANARALPRSLRLASLAQLKHPYSVDLYIERVLSKARFVLIRLLGGLDYWRYGVEEVARVARSNGFALAIVPGDHREDPRLDAASTLPKDELRRIWAFFQNGGATNIASLFGWIAARIGEPDAAWSEPEAVPPADRHRAACHAGAADAPRALVVFYRSMMLAGDAAPVCAMADALAARGFAVTSAYVTSLKDPAAARFIETLIDEERPDVVVNTTAFSARDDDGRCVLDKADAPVLQAMLTGSSQEGWQENPRGLGPADLAMNVVLPEIDGRIITTALSCKAETARSERLEFARLVHQPLPSRTAFIADLALNWARLRRTPEHARHVALVLSDYPGKQGRSAYALGLDTPASVAAIAEDLRAVGYTIGDLPSAAELMRHLSRDTHRTTVSVQTYRAWLDALPPEFRADLVAAWGEPEDDPQVRDGLFQHAWIEAGHLLIALQPDRATAAERKAAYHDMARPPCHAYVAFYLWLRHARRIDALVHCGTHGTLEWLPGKALALSDTCAPEVVLGPTPLLYPFIVNNPGEAAQAKRRNGAVIIGHMTPPLMDAGLDGVAAEIEHLFDEFAAAETLDPPRAALIARTLVERIEETGLAAECGIDPRSGREALIALDSWLCDIKEMRIRDGLHIFGRGTDADCAAGERQGLRAGLDGRFVPAGPAGAPSRARADIKPTGRNLYGTDPRAVPSRTAYEIGKRAAEAVIARYVEDNGDWPRSLVLDLWASATMRTSGEDLAQALAYLGLRPTWEAASARVTGFEILPSASLGRPRIDVTLRISGLFRDIFPAQITLFDQAVKAVFDLDEPDDINPLAAKRRAGGGAARIFGGAPSNYGLGLAQRIEADPLIDRAELGAAYLSGATHAYGGAEALGVAVGDRFTSLVAEADAFVHSQDLEGFDLLDAQANVEAEAGFAAATESLGRRVALYHLDTIASDRPKVRTQTEDVARIVRGRIANPRWIAGLMRHGYRGASEIAESIDNLYAMAVMSDAVSSRQFDLAFTATLGTAEVRSFLEDANRDAALAIARKFDLATRRGYWTSRRNSDAVILAEMLGS